jgi:hypothetical protein
MTSSSGDNLYAWLEIMFTFCAGKPFVYDSRYVQAQEFTELRLCITSESCISRFRNSLNTYEHGTGRFVLWP